MPIDKAIGFYFSISVPESIDIFSREEFNSIALLGQETGWSSHVNARIRRVYSLRLAP